MTIKIDTPASAPAGTYKATFAGVEEKTSQRDGSTYRRWTFSADIAGAATTVSGISSAATGPQSKAYRWLGVLLGRSPRPSEMIDEATLAGRPCLIVLEENEQGFANVVDVTPAQAGTERTPDPSAVERDQYEGLPF